jgi:hypothetical protein
MTQLFFGTPHAALNVETLVLYFIFIFLSECSCKHHVYFEKSYNTLVAYLETRYREEYLNVKMMKWEKEVSNPNRSQYCYGMVRLQRGLLWACYKIQWVDRQGFGKLILMWTFRKRVVSMCIYSRLLYLLLKVQG